MLSSDYIYYFIFPALHLDMFTKSITTTKEEIIFI